MSDYHPPLDSDSSNSDDRVNSESRKNVLDEHAALERFLAESGLQRGDVPGWQVVSAAEMNHALGRTGKSRVSGDGVEIPYLSLDGEPVLDRGQPFRRYRLLKPEQGGAKYLSRAGSCGHIYVPGRLRELLTDEMDRRSGGTSDGQDPPHAVDLLVICEGEKKAERLVKLGIPAIALAGVDMWADDAARAAEKAAAERDGRKPPPLSKNSKVSREIEALIRKIDPARIVVIFDSDGNPVDTADVDGDSRFKPILTGEKSVLNVNVYWAARKLAAALLRSRAVTDRGRVIAWGFAPHAVRENGRLDRQGIDDWSLTVGADEVLAFVEKLADAGTRASDAAANAAEAETARAERRERALRDQGFRALGYASNGESTTFYVWSKPLEVVKAFTGSSLARKAECYGALGEDYCDEILGRQVMTDPGSEKQGRPPVFEMRFDLDRAARVITSECTRAGRWSPDASVRGAGVWADEQTGGLVVNCATGLFLVRPDGAVENVDRVRGGAIYESTGRGGWTDETASTDDVLDVIGTIEKSWNWAKKADGTLMAGWLFSQAYVGALKARPGAMTTGESGCGKSYKEEWAKRLIGPWAVRIEDTRGTSLAGVSQLIKRDAVTVFFDEIEPKAGASPDEAARVNRTIDSIRQMLRSAYSRSDDAGSYGAVKGTAHQEAVAREVRICGMMASIAEPELEQADRNRNLRLKLRRLEVDEDGKPVRRPPPLPDPTLGLRIFRLMWSRWTAFQETLEKIEQMIDHREARMRSTLGVPLAAYVVALGMENDEKLVEAAVNRVNAEYGGAAGDDDAPRDQDRALQRLLAVAIEVGGAKKAIGDAVVAALAAGLGRPGGGRGAGGPDGDALRLNGLTARRNHDGTVSLFVAAGHAGVEELGRRIGVAGLASLLGAVEGATAAKRDDRVRLGAGGKWPGVWAPTDIATIAVVEGTGEPETAQPMEEAAPY